MTTSPLRNLAMLALREKDVAAAEGCFDRCVQTNQKALGENSSAVASLANVYLVQKNYTKSEASQLRAIKIFDAIYGKDSQKMASLSPASATSTISGKSRKNPLRATENSSPSAKNFSVRKAGIWSATSLPKRKLCGNLAVRTTPQSWNSAHKPFPPRKIRIDARCADSSNLGSIRPVKPRTL
jgi:tetratricopeptide repeat protein